MIITIFWQWIIRLSVLSGPQRWIVQQSPNLWRLLQKSKALNAVTTVSVVRFCVCAYPASPCVCIHVILSAQHLSLCRFRCFFFVFLLSCWWCCVSPLLHCSLKTYSLQANVRTLQWSWPTLAWPLRFRGINRPGLVCTVDTNIQHAYNLHLLTKFYLFYKDVN